GTPGSSPTARYHAAMVYDSQRARTVLFGGATSSGPNGETWEWNGTTWTQRMVTGPPARQGHAMAYDSARHVTVLFGGFTSSTRLADTWEWNGTAWTQQMVSGPSARDDGAMAFDASRTACVLYGGFTASPPAVPDEVGAWNGTVWSTLTPASGDAGARRYHSMVYDTQRGKLIVFGGDVGGPLDGGTWSLDSYTPVSIDLQPLSQ